MALGIVASYKGWLKYQKTCSELHQLSNRELDDLGIKRHEIDALARKASGY